MSTCCIDKKSCADGLNDRNMVVFLQDVFFILEVIDLDSIGVRWEGFVGIVWFSA